MADTPQTAAAKKLLKQEGAVEFIVEMLQSTPEVAAGYGYDLYVTKVMTQWVERHKSQIPDPGGWSSSEYYVENIPYISEVFFAAAWELCRLGVVRPGVKRLHAQATDDGSAGNGYSVTPFGRTWLVESVSNSFYVPTEPGRFASMLEQYAPTFGDGFKERANQAIRCYMAHAYLACCVMCGAATESVLLRLAIDKTGNEELVLKQYGKAGGRKKIEDIVWGKVQGLRKEDFTSGFSLLKYWRDESAHGRASAIGENEAYTSLSLMLRCAQFAKDNYSALTT